jgi:hypothetical protein
MRCHLAGNIFRTSGAVHHWRAAEVVKAVEARRLPEATVLREAYEAL